MGHSSKKKKKRGGGGGGGRRSQIRDHHSLSSDNSDIVTDEVTALCAIFQDDCEVVSEPLQVNIKLRPYSMDTTNEAFAVLSVRFLQGYPYKCPKLEIVPEKGITDADANNLLSRLIEQANSNAREGRVMIFNLVEAAQEFLSEITPSVDINKLVLNHEISKHKEPLEDCPPISSARICSIGKSFICSHVDLFVGCGELWQWNLGIEEGNEKTFPTAKSLKPENSNLGKQQKTQAKLSEGKNDKAEYLNKQSLVLGTLEEESEDETKGADSSESDGVPSVNDSKDIFVEVDASEPDYEDISNSNSFSSSEANGDQPTQVVKTDLLLVHLLRLACNPEGPLAHCLPEITTELFNMGIVSKTIRDMAIEPSPSFDKTFDHAFRKHISSSTLSRFWGASSNFDGRNSSVSNSRYLNDFEELQPLGHGGFGHVVLCKNKIDGRQYAVKKIRLNDNSVPIDDRILREVTTLSRLQHQHVVRYYQAWYEWGAFTNPGSTAWDSRTGKSSSLAFKDTSFTENSVPGSKIESTYLYIQMEYCPRTLRQMFESYGSLNKELAWHFFRQIVEGLAHIHSQGIIHRDLTPNNIFFDARNDIKIGDFGLAKFLKLDQLDHDVDPSEVVGYSIDGTGQIGTYLYTAPEIEQAWPKINEKADMYSLGVIFFELWYPFGTAMERHVVLSDLKKGELPPDWVKEFPEQASLLRRLMCPIPSDRPSAAELLKHAFPPEMQYEMLDNILSTIHNAEDTRIFDKLVSAIFDEDKLTVEHSRDHDGRAKSFEDDKSTVPLTTLDTPYRDLAIDHAREICKRHCAVHVEIIPMKILGYFQRGSRNSVKLLTRGGDMVELSYELRLPFVDWVIKNQKSFFRRYEISYVYRRAIGHSPPNRYLQVDFDVVGGKTALTEAEVIKATIDIVSQFFNPESFDICLNHGDLLEAIWFWTGIKIEKRQKVAELLSLLGSLRPQSSERKSKWVVIRRQLKQELDLADDVLNKLQTVGLRFCGSADLALPRLRGALPSDKSTCKALDEISELFKYLRIWKIDVNTFLDALMPPTEKYHRNLYFQVYLRNSHKSASLMEGILLAVGGRYDYLLQQMADSENKAYPGAVGTSIALETILLHSSADGKYSSNISRNDSMSNILVCSRGGGGLLVERMELVAELWEENIKADFVPLPDPSLTEQYEYANEHGIKCLVVMTDSDVSQKGLVKVRHLEMKREKDVMRTDIVKFLSMAMATNFRNPSIWN